MSHAVIIDHAVKTYGDFTAVNGISLTIHPGESLRCWVLPAAEKPRCFV